MPQIGAEVNGSPGLNSDRDHMSENVALERILDRYRAPSHAGPLAEATHAYVADNPTCGDRVTLRFVVRDNRIAACRFEAEACALTTAAASVLAEALEGLSMEAARRVSVADMERLLPQPFGPERTACFLLPLHAARMALFGDASLTATLRGQGSANAGIAAQRGGTA